MMTNFTSVTLSTVCVHYLLTIRFDGGLCKLLLKLIMTKLHIKLQYKLHNIIMVRMCRVMELHN